MNYVLRCMYKSPQSGLFMLRKNVSHKNKTKTQMNIFNKKIGIILSIAFTVSAVCLLFFIPIGKSQSPGILDTEINTTDLIILTNEIRNIKGLNPLTENIKLQTAATNKAKHLIQHDYFSHNSPAGKQFSEWIIESGYNFQIVGENLAIGFESNKEVMKAWMDSPSHKENILNEKYNEIGLIVMQGDINGKLETIIVQIFGSQPVLRLSESFSKYIETSPLSLNHSYS